MKRIYILVAVVTLVGMFYGVAQSQLAPPAIERPVVRLGVPGEAARPAADAPYHIFGQDEGAVMIEMKTGKTWMLMRSRHTVTPLVWMPIQRLETGMDVERWQKAEEDYKAEKKRQRELE